MARLKAVVGTPWQPKGDSSEPLGLERRERFVYITLERQLKHVPILRTAPDATVMTKILNRTPRSAERFSKLYPKIRAGWNRSTTKLFRASEGSGSTRSYRGAKPKLEGAGPDERG